MDTPSLEQNLEALRFQGRMPIKQSLRGFEEQYQDIVDYIVRITHRIWEEADMGYIYDTYSSKVSVHTAYGTAYGIEEVISGSIAFLAALPDRRMYAEDVIWSGDDEAGFHTSHLIMNTGSNTGYSPWGPPTGRRVHFLAIANCFVKENKVVEEWLVRDTAALIRQLGFDPWEIARASALKLSPVYGETERLQGQFAPQAFTNGDDEIENFVRKSFHDIWNGRHFNLIASSYNADASLHVPGHLTIRGLANIKAYHLNFIAMFPDACMGVEQVYWQGDEASGYRVAVRWRFGGTHERYGWYGKPSNKRVDMLGISQIHIRDGKILKHYMVFDDLAVMMQLVS